MNFPFLRYFFIFLFFLNGSVFWAQERLPLPSLSDSISEETAENRAKKLMETLPQNTDEVREISFPNLKEKYNSEAFDYSENEKNSLVQRFFKLLKRILEMFFDTDIDSYSKNLLKFLYIVIFLTALGVAIYFIMNHKGRWFWEKNNKKLILSMEDVEKNIHIADFQELIKQSENQNNTRQSIRLYYLWLLKTLSDKKIIEWHLEKTNSDYIREIKDENIKRDFAYLSRIYNYIWYGEFSIEETEYQQAKNDFNKYLKS